MTEQGYLSMPSSFQDNCCQVEILTTHDQIHHVISIATFIIWQLTSGSFLLSGKFNITWFHVYLHFPGHFSIILFVVPI